MPQSEKPRKKASERAGNRLQLIIQQAQALDRRRQAQIQNQIGTINRLLERFDAASEADHLNRLDPHAQSSIPTSHAAYSEEMRTLHEAAAELVAREQETREALQELVRALDNRVGLHQAAMMLETELVTARRVLGLSAPVSESGASAG